MHAVSIVGQPTHHLVGENGLRKRHATSGQVFGFGQWATSGCFVGACLGDLTITLMLLEFCERCFAGTSPLVDPRALAFGAEGVEG
jgi:hypothetical protein